MACLARKIYMASYMDQISMFDALLCMLMVLWLLLLMVAVSTISYQVYILYKCMIIRLLLPYYHCVVTLFIMNCELYNTTAHRLRKLPNLDIFSNISLYFILYILFDFYLHAGIKVYPCK